MGPPDAQLFPDGIGDPGVFRGLLVEMTAALTSAGYFREKKRPSAILMFRRSRFRLEFRTALWRFALTQAYFGNPTFYKKSLLADIYRSYEITSSEKASKNFRKQSKANIEIVVIRRRVPYHKKVRLTVRPNLLNFNAKAEVETSELIERQILSFVLLPAAQIFKPVAHRYEIPRPNRRAL